VSSRRCLWLTQLTPPITKSAPSRTSERIYLSNPSDAFQVSQSLNSQNAPSLLYLQAKLNNFQARAAPPNASVHPSHSKPVKSAMKRSRSIRTNASTTIDKDVSRCIPKGLHGGHGGLLIPTKPHDSGKLYSHDSGPKPAVSPEWGWYINTTPPTPEMYQPKPVKKISYTGARPSPLTNPAFSNGPGKGAMGWPSIPL